MKQPRTTDSLKLTSVQAPSVGPRPPSSAGPSRVTATLTSVLLGICLGMTGLVQAEGVDEIDINHAPVFLLTGVAPNLILTLDDSESMTAANADSFDDVEPKYDPRDTAAISNSQYYDPMIVYLPPVGADGKQFPHADFTAAPRDFFRNTVNPGTDVDCVLDLSANYAPLWDEGVAPCTERDENKDGIDKIGPAQSNNEYTVDPAFVKFVPDGELLPGEGNANANAVVAANRARYCLPSDDADDEAGEEKERCPAFYYVWDPDRSKGGASCGDLDDLTESEIAGALPDCLERIEVGTDSDINQTALAVHEERAELLGSGEKKELSKRNFANWYSYYRNRWRTLQTAISRVTTTLDPAVRVAYQRLINGGVTELGEINSTFGSFNDSSRKAFQDWLFARQPTYRDTALISSALRVEHFCATDLAYLQDAKRAKSDDNPVLGCRNNFHLLFTDGLWADNVSDIKSDASWLGNNDGTAIGLPTDRAYADTFSPAISAYDPTSDATSVYADSNIGGLADAVFHSWITDLRPNENGDDHRVPTLIWDPTIPEGESDAYVFWNSSNDPADWQHVTTYTVGLGVQGEIEYPLGDYGTGKNIELDGFPGGFNSISSKKGGGTPPTDAQKIDDLWHAGINGRGGYSSASNPQVLIDSFQQVMDAVSAVAKDNASAAAPAINSGSVGNTRIVFQAQLSSSDWTGDLLAFGVSGGPGVEPCPSENKARGVLCSNPEWSAADELDDPVALWTNRTLVTATREVDADTNQTLSQSGVAFGGDHFGDLYTYDANALLGSVDDDEEEAKAVLDYIAGKRDYESLRRGPDDSYTFRDRNSLLGDIINAGPVVVSAPNRYFNDSAYNTFANANASRKEIVYVGANDGLLHAFDTADGEELFAYVPRPLLGKLAKLAAPAYGGAHDNFVDGPIAEGDAKFSNDSWNSVLVGALGRGAQALYAIRSPSLSGDGKPEAAQVHLWDFTDQDDPDLGYVFGKPAIVRVLMSDGTIKWVAVFGNGYNSSANDGARAAGCDDDAQDSSTTACGRAVLYVVDIETGSLVAKFDTQQGRTADPRHSGVAREPNGLGQPTVIGRILTQDGSQIGGGDPIATKAYAGDLFGNLWRFDLNKLDAAGTVGASPNLVFQARNADGIAQPITAPVVVAPHPTGVGTLVLFGTGRYLALTDVTDTTVQSFYGIWDQGDAGSLGSALVSRNDLLLQELVETGITTQSADGGGLYSEGRISTRNPIDWASDEGWALDLAESADTNTGERVVQPPQLRGDRVVFVSLIPESNPCKGGGEGWVNAVSFASGAALDVTPFDYDGNGAFDNSDLLTTSEGAKVTGSSIRLAAGGIYSGPAALPIAGGDTKTVVSNSAGDLIELLESSALRWRVWQQLQ